MHHRRCSSAPPVVEGFGSARPSLASFPLGFSPLSLPPGYSFFSLPLGFSLTASMASPSLSNSRLTLTLTLDFGEPMYGSRVLCEPVCVGDV
uniref:Uncharacterized protein n=1 Tax=Fagus sylvatica TaxID=28930 RepID=A0A2N9FEJ1_FAGSY